MRSTLTPPSERTMPPGHHERRRVELLRLTATPRSRTRTAVPLLAAASVVAVTASVVAVPALRSQPPPSSPAGPAATIAAVGTIKPAPAVHDLTSAELAAFRKVCERWNDTAPSVYAGFTTVAGIRFTGERRWQVPASWLILRRGAQHTVCVRNGRGEMIGTTGFGPESVKDLEYLYAPVDVRGQGTGPYTKPVARVTVQGKTGPEQEAVLRHGFWFAPYDEQRYYTRSGNPPRPKENSNLIGVPYGYTFRGYDSAGRLVYDSAKNGPSIEACYTDPSGQTVIDDNDVPNQSPTNCRRTLLWTP